MTANERMGGAGLVIYDGSCGVCSTFVGRNRAFFEKHGFAVAALQEPWVAERTGLEEAVLMQAIHLLTPGGAILRGVDFFAYVAGTVWWLWPIQQALRVPLFRRGFARGYDFIARRRQHISRACGFSPKA